MKNTGIRVVDVSTLERNEWLEYRKHGIGGSDVGAICSLSRFKSPLEVFMDKTNQLPPTPDNARMAAGRRLEPFIADWFQEETGIQIEVDSWMYQHPEHKFMLANVDRIVSNENAGVEIKNTSEFGRSDWFNGQEETVPIEYMLQCNHYMAVTGAEKWYVAVLIGGWDMQWRVIERDESLIQNLITIESNFWKDLVLTQTPPDVTAGDTKLLTMLHPESQPTHMAFYESDYGLIHEFFETKESLALAETRHEEVKNKIKMRMGAEELAYWNGEKLFSWKTNTRGSRVFKTIGGI